MTTLALFAKLYVLAGMVVLVWTIMLQPAREIREAFPVEGLSRTTAMAIAVASSIVFVLVWPVIYVMMYFKRHA